MTDRQRLLARSRLALWLAAFAAVVMLPLLLSAPLELRTGQLVLLAAALALGLVAYLNQAALGDRIHFDALAGLVLILLATAGPLPAFGLLAFGDLLYRLLERPRAMAQLANLASYGWGLLAATGVLGLLGYPAGAGVSTLAGAAALAVAGSACVTVNYCVTRGLVAVVADGQPAVATFRREFVPMLPAQVTVVAVGAVSATLGAWVGVLGLLPIVVAVIAADDAGAAHPSGAGTGHAATRRRPGDLCSGSRGRGRALAPHASPADHPQRRRRGPSAGWVRPVAHSPTPPESPSPAPGARKSPRTPTHPANSAPAPAQSPRYP